MSLDNVDRRPVVNIDAVRDNSDFVRLSWIPEVFSVGIIESFSFSKGLEVFVAAMLPPAVASQVTGVDPQSLTETIERLQEALHQAGEPEEEYLHFAIVMLRTTSNEAAVELALSLYGVWNYLFHTDDAVSLEEVDIVGIHTPSVSVIDDEGNKVAADDETLASLELLNQVALSFSVEELKQFFGL